MAYKLNPLHASGLYRPEGIWKDVSSLSPNRLSTSTFSLSNVNDLEVNTALKYSSDGTTYYYGLISDITGTTITIQGVELPASISHLYYFTGEVIELTYILMNGSLDSVADNIQNLYDNTPVLISRSKLLAITTKCNGNSTTPAQIQIRRGSDTNDILTANLNVTDTYTNSGVTIDSTYYEFDDFETELSIDCLNIGDADGTEIMLKFYFINKD